jgi:6-phosphogluconolactonase
MAAPPLREFPDRDALVRALTDVCRDAVVAAVEARGRANVALSGGSTPAPLYRALAAEAIDWCRVTLALVDERWVAPDHEASNERLARESFATALAAGATLATMNTTAASADEALGEVEARYRRLRPFDLIVLGMGVDGHAASWFPAAQGLAQALDPADGETVAAVRAVGSAVAGAYVERMTLTRPAVAEARRGVLMLVGAEKRDAWARAAAPGPEAAMPVRALWRDPAAALEAYWAP